MALEQEGPNGWRQDFPSFRSNSAKRVESPIELKMLRALATAEWPKPGSGGFAVTHPTFVRAGRIAISFLTDRVLSLDAQLDALKPQINISTQVAILNYRADILVEAGLRIACDKVCRLVVECDGYDYHSSPEAQNRDAVRDAQMWRAGYRVVRFTGGQINRNPDRCANRVVEAVMNMHMELAQNER